MAARSSGWTDPVAFKARMEGPVSGNVLLRQDQYRKVDDADKCLDLARRFIAGKLRNCR
jgi:CRISP-associated protein Cas1